MILAGDPFRLDDEHPDFWGKFKPKGLHECAACYIDINQDFKNDCIAYPTVYDWADDYGNSIWPQGSVVHVCRSCYEESIAGERKASELLPCPFCGGSEIQIDEMESVWHLSEQGAGEVYWRIICLDCAAEISTDTKHEAMAAWNNRAENAAKTVIHKRTLVGDYCCPNCSAAFIGIVEDKGKLRNTTPFCGNCGQKLDWGENNAV